MTPSWGRVGTAAASVVLLLSMVTACAPDPEAGSPTASRTASSAPGVTSSAAPSPDASASAIAARIPTDCQQMLSPAVSAELASTPLNDPVLGVPTGMQADGSLICIWRDPAADTTYLSTDISGMNRGRALDMLNDFADTQGFTCYTPDDGVRCEKTWQNAQYPVTDGRTLYWRDDILIDTQYSNLAPAGYTDSIIATIWG